MHAIMGGMGLLGTFFLSFSFITLPLAFEGEEEPPISQKYYRGRYLIFDCQNQHFACVNAFSFNLCKNWRVEDRKKDLSRLRCAPLKEFPSQKICFREQMKQIERPRQKVFCLQSKLIKGPRDF